MVFTISHLSTHGRMRGSTAPARSDSCARPISGLCAVLLLSLTLFLLLLSGCVQTGTPSAGIRTGDEYNKGPAITSNASSSSVINSNAPAPVKNVTSPSSVPNASSPPASSANNSSTGANASKPSIGVYVPFAPNSSNSTLAQVSAHLLAIDELFLNQTQEATDAAANLKFSDAAKLFNLSAYSAAQLTAELSQVCALRGINCTNELNGYARISLCARERAAYYWQVETLMPILNNKLNCTAQVQDNSSAPTPACTTNDSLYANACTALMAQSSLTRAICEPVMPGINVVESSVLICHAAGQKN